MVAPDWLSPIALEEWHRTVADLRQQGRLDTVDAAMLAAFCVELATYRELTIWLAEHGKVIVLPNGISAMRPETKIADTSLKNAMKLAAEFGLTPSSRARAHVDVPEEVADWRREIS